MLQWPWTVVASGMMELFQKAQVRELIEAFRWIQNFQSANRGGEAF